MIAVPALRGWAAAARAATGTFNTALPVAKGEFVFRGRFFYRKASDDPDSGGTRLFVAPGLRYIAERWVLAAIVRAGFRFDS